MKNLFIILLLVVTLFACKKEIIVSGDDYLTFGSFHGECMGDDCVKLYVIKETKLFENPNDFNITELAYIGLSNEKYLEVKDLIDYIPNQLLSKEKETFGCPDCVDQGGLYVRYVLDGKSGEFRIDTDKTKIPSYLHSFVDKINEKMDLL